MNHFQLSTKQKNGSPGFALLLIYFFSIQFLFSAEHINLKGLWQFQIDSTNAGIDEKWFSKELAEQIQLPGTMDDAGFGIPSTLEPRLEKPQLLRLTRKNSYVGPAWYSKQISIPKNWKNKQITLKLERVIWETSVWINGIQAREIQESLSTPHYFDLTGLLMSGENKLTIRVDNRKKYDISVRDLAHAYTNETQIIWNGILGEIQCVAEDKVNISNIQIFPDVQKKSAKAILLLENNTTSSQKVKIQLSAFLKQSEEKLQPFKKHYRLSKGTNKLEIEYPMGDNPALWDEFNPNIYILSASLQGTGFKSEKSTTFGMRSLTNKEAKLQINGHQLFLRGTLECAIFPLTGHPPMDKGGWVKVFNTAKTWGLNHIRFHSWCPPKQAFEVADSLGIYLQVELPYWALTVGNDNLTTNFLKEEADNIIREYGNHPSFCFWAMGNELEGDFSILKNLVDSLKSVDPRHLYSTTSFTFQKGFGRKPVKQDDFFITQWTDNGWVRGQGIFNTNPPDFHTDYQKAIAGFEVPLITHEIGQYSVYPNMKEIEKYSGVLDPLNLKAIRDDLKLKGLLHRADDYFNASGRLAAVLYKEEIERAMKTPGISGFQLLDLHDFPGQGTALVGLLDAFWDNKGFTTPEAFRQACSELVPLVRFPKAVYENNETFIAKTEVANYSSKTYNNITLKWTFTNSKKELINSGLISNTNIAHGYNEHIASIEIPLQKIDYADKFTLTLWLENTAFSNSWNVWVYPMSLPEYKSDVVYTRNVEEAIKAATEGKNVLFNPSWKKTKGIEGKFVPVFWSPVHFPKQAGTMGLLCDPGHPALKNFPTDKYTDWQWWDLIKNSTTIILDSISSPVTPIIEMIDNFTTNRRLCNTFEAKLGKGKILVTTIDLQDNIAERPAARQLKYSLIQYMNSGKFNPTYQIKIVDLKSIIDSDGQQNNETPDSIY